MCPESGTEDFTLLCQRWQTVPAEGDVRYLRRVPEGEEGHPVEKLS